MLVEEKQNQESSDLFFLLPSTTDRKKKINEVFGNVHLHPVDCLYNDFTSYSSNNQKFYPSHLEPRNTTEREAGREIVLNYMRFVPELSSQNLVCNANSLMTNQDVKTDVQFSWVSNVNPQNHQTKFKLGY